MTKRIFMLFMGLLFLGACGGDDSSEFVDDPDGDGVIGFFDEGEGEESGLGEEQADLVSGDEQAYSEDLASAQWKCEKEEGVDLHYYHVNQQPTTVDGAGTDNERPRVCELERVEVDGSFNVFRYANNQKTYCVDHLNQTLAGKRAQGFTCVQTIENSITEQAPTEPATTEPATTEPATTEPATTEQEG